jgi:hypothetical protein
MLGNASIAAYSTAQKTIAAAILSFWQNYVPAWTAIAFVANADRETSLNPKAVGDNDKAFNIGQWHWIPRGAAILTGCGIDIRTASLENALIAMHWELTNVEIAAWAKIKACTTSTEAARATCEYYQRAGAADAPARSAELATMWAAHFGVAAT